MYISKHHYAIELAAMGNTVYFLNPPEQEKNRWRPYIKIENQKDYPGLFLISHKVWFPYILKFKALPLFQRLMYFHLRNILKKIGRPVDIIWSFDLGNIYPLRYFGARPLKIFHPVDEPLTLAAIDAASGADIIFSVTTEILEKYTATQIPAHLINHGVSDKFLAGTKCDYQPQTPIQAGISGNFLRNDIDRAVLLQIIRENANVVFNCWGSFRLDTANIGGGTDEPTKAFIHDLQSLPNVILHGAVPADRLADAIQAMDILLICYDIEKDQSKGTNYHKIMEYLATGKVVVSNNVTAYKGREDLVLMPTERTTNKELPELFKKIISALAEYNSKDKMAARYSYAAENTYQQQLRRIEQKIVN